MRKSWFLPLGLLPPLWFTKAKGKPVSFVYGLIAAHRTHAAMDRLNYSDAYRASLMPYPPADSYVWPTEAQGVDALGNQTLSAICRDANHRERLVYSSL